VQADEIWAFCYAKDKNVATAKAAPEGAGDVWTWTAIDRDHKMILAFEVGDRSGATALDFMTDLRARLATRVQLTTDGHKAFLEAVEGAFGMGRGLCHAGQAVWQCHGAEGAREEIQPRRMHRST
jgi:IS1 family transposase